jgi:hypothetical protein
MEYLFLIFLTMTFLIGMYVTVFWEFNLESIENQNDSKNNEKEVSSCPNLLVQKGASLLLHDTSKPTGDNNPIPFFNLDEYIQYLEVQKREGKECPVLYLQAENNAQGEDVYRMRPSPFDLQGGLQATNNLKREEEGIIKRTDANRDNKPYNQNMFAGFDPQGQFVGQYTNIDKIHDSTSQQKISDNPMDDNWAGTTYTQQMIDSGKYKNRQVTKPSFFKPKTVFNPTAPSIHPTPRDIL